MSNVRHAIRTLTSQPAATTVVVLTNAVAIATTTVIYSVIDLVWGFIHAVNRNGLVYIASTDTRVLQGEGSTRNVVLRSRVSMPDFADWSARRDRRYRRELPAGVPRRWTRSPRCVSDVGALNCRSDD